MSRPLSYVSSLFAAVSLILLVLSFSVMDRFARAGEPLTSSCLGAPGCHRLGLGECTESATCTHPGDNCVCTTEQDGCTCEFYA